ncbi:MAG: hypothetical protein Q9169_004204 [Polycauliona sp. 2 TL-2023]
MLGKVYLEHDNLPLFNAKNKTVFWPKQVRSVRALRDELGIDDSTQQKSPRCRFLYVVRHILIIEADNCFSFVHAPNSRDKLRTTRHMLALSFSYLQVMPEFLDFLFPFGKQVNERGFHFGGFRYTTRLAESEKGLTVPELGWSGYDYQVCYNLKSVEQAQGGGEPWSIRQAAIHHSFEVKSGQSSWIVIKANTLLQTKIQSATGLRGLRKVCLFDGVDKAFGSTLATHLIFCQWSGENWRWYIEYLEDQFQQGTQDTLAPITRAPTSPLASPDKHTPRQYRRRVDGAALGAMQTPVPHPGPSSRPLELHPLLHYTNDPRSIPDNLLRPGRMASRQEFSFTDVQRTHHTEKNANAATLVLKNNISVFADIKRYYRTIMSFEGWPSELTDTCHEVLSRFEQDLSSIENEMRLQLSRLETLLQWISDRKSLVSRQRIHLELG